MLSPAFAREIEHAGAKTTSRERWKTDNAPRRFRERRRGPPGHVLFLTMRELSPEDLEGVEIIGRKLSIKNCGLGQMGEANTSL